MRREVMGLLVGLMTLYDAKAIDTKTYEDGICQLCDEYGTEFVAEILVVMGMATPSPLACLAANGRGGQSLCQ